MTGLFLFFFLLTTLGQLYLSIRQSRHVRAYRQTVPEAFQTTVSLAEHQKAAAYTLAKQRLNRYEILFQAALLLVFTLGGGLDALAAISQRLSASPLTQGVWLIALFMLVNLILSWPFALYKTFKL